MKNIVILKLLLITVLLNSCASIATHFNERKNEEIIITRKLSANKQKINLEVIRNNIKISATEINEYTETKDTFPKKSKEFNFASASSSGYTFTIGGGIATILNSGLVNPNKPNNNLFFGVAGVMVADLLLAAFIGNLEKTSESKKIVEEKILDRYKYQMIIGKKYYDGMLDENGIAIIENVFLDKTDFDYGEAKFNIFLDDNKVYTEKIELEKLKSLIK